MQEQLHIEARAYAETLRESGADFDKKMLRWNEIVEVGMFYAACGEVPLFEVAIAGVREAVQACVKGHDMYVHGQGPLSMIQPWMRYRNN